MSAIRYIIEVIICSGLFLVIYRWLLARKVSFRLCRAYIMATMILAAAIPAMDVPMYTIDEQRNQYALLPYLMSDDMALEDAAAAEAYSAETAATGDMQALDASAVQMEKSKADVRKIVTWALICIYILAAAASLSLVLYSSYRISLLRKRSKLTHTEEYTLAEHEEIKTPFSFIRTIFLGYDYERYEREQIITHEASHVRHGHSYERIALSILRSLFWFNPFFWMAEKSLEEVQEWEADKDVLNEGYELDKYRTTIFKQLFGYNPDISCGLNHSLTKQRFIMMTQSHRGKGAWIRLAATLPVIAAAFFAFGCGTKEAKASTDFSTDLTNGTEQTYLPMCPPCDASVSNSFGARTDASGAGTHQGIDYVLKEGDPVYAAADGEISSITRDDSNGLMLVLNHSDGIETRYAHLSKIQIVSHLKIEGGMMTVNNTYNLITDGDHSNQKISGKVNRGQLIGYAGSTGRATGPHLHFEVRKDGKPVDPAPMFTSDKPVTAPFPIYIVEGTNKPGEEYFAICNGKLCKINDEIGEAVSRYFAEIDDPQYATIQLEADKDVPEAVLTKVSEQLRKVQALKVSKSITESNPGEIVVLKDATTTYSRIANGALIEVIYDPNESRIYIDGARHSLDEVAEVIGAKRDSSDKPYEFTVQIKASGDTRMGIITDIKNELRTINGIRLLYTLDEMVTPDHPYAEAEIDPYYKVETYKESRNNIIVIKTNAADRYLIGDRPDYLDDKVLERVKSYILNKENNPDLPDKTDKEFTLPDGRIITYPVSQAMILMQNDRGTSFEGYQAVNAFVQKAYRELRNDLATELFGRALAELSDAETAIIRQAIPMNVCEAEPKDAPARR
ncbi:MAG: peptidoglycan DD-metalloendopeptidase family protein [Bacteroidales bacterium]|nr:peptidoglycan DD-metalloendopeptidase family protein [Bacteroidales bacterium]